MQTVPNARVPNGAIDPFTARQHVPNEGCIAGSTKRERESKRERNISKKLYLEQCFHSPHYLCLSALHKGDGPTPVEVPLPFTAQICRRAVQKDLTHYCRLVVLVLLGDNDFSIAQLALQRLEGLGAIVGETQLLARCHSSQILDSSLHLAQHIDWSHHQIVVLAILFGPIGPVQYDIEHFGIVMQWPLQAVIQDHLIQGQLMCGQPHLLRVLAAQLVGSLRGRNGCIHLCLFLQNKVEI